MGYTMRTAEHRLTLWTKADDPQYVKAVELYDHQNGDDLVETVNLADDLGHQELLDQLTQEFRRRWPWKR